MKKIILALALMGSFLSADSVAQVGLGYSQGANDEDMVTGFAGINLISNFGARLEYTKNFSEHPEFSKDDISRYGIFATYTLPLISGLSLTPKVGYTQTDGEFTLKNTGEKISKEDSKLTYGLEANYQFTQNLSLFVGYTDYGNEMDIKNIDTDKMKNENYSFGLKLDI
ncbi:MAG: porin family protein [Sulfurovum sp.]|nr:MAG: porin family protein [Sulfurovum sp.]